MRDERLRRPGDLILARYVPDAAPEDREAARESLRAQARAYMRIIARLIREGREHELIEASAVNDKIGLTNIL